VARQVAAAVTHTCPQCHLYAVERGPVIAACDGVDPPEHGRATRRALILFLAEYHQAGHDRNLGPSPKGSWIGCEIS
jgi:hypothetical protein